MKTTRVLNGTVRGLACIALSLLLTVPALSADPALIAAAMKEGQVRWYTGLIAEEAAKPMVAAFMKRYPGIKAEFVRMNGSDIAKKIVEEAKQGTMQGDVFDSTTSVAVLMPAGLIEPYRADSSKDIPEQYKDPNGFWASQVVYFTTVGYNADLVAPGDVPKSYEDLLDPKWRGKIGWSSSGLASATGFVANVLMTMGDGPGMAYLEKLKGQNIVRIPGGGNEALGAVAKGTVLIGLQIFNHHTLIYKKRGAKVEWIKLEPLFGFSNPIGLVKNAPHPNAGKLLIDYVLSEEGQRVLRDADHIPANIKVDAPEASLKSGFRVNFVSPEMTEQNTAKWQAIVKKLFP